MLAKFLQLLMPRASFYDDTGDRTRPAPALSRKAHERRVERWIVIGWVLILAKCAAMWWAIEKYQVPIHPLWLVGPTILFGLLATAVYIWRD